MERRSRPGSRRLLPAPVALLALLSGCSSSDSAAPTPGVSSPAAAVTTTSASVTPTVAAPVLPEAAKQPTRPGAEAFFRYFIDVYTYTFTSQDTTPMRTISDSGCTFCTGAVEDAESSRANGEHVVGGVGTVTYAARHQASRRKGCSSTPSSISRLSPWSTMKASPSNRHRPTDRCAWMPQSDGSAGPGRCEHCKSSRSRNDSHQRIAAAGDHHPCSRSEHTPSRRATLSESWAYSHVHVHPERRRDACSRHDSR